MDDIKQGIKSLANGKASDIDGLQAEFLNWGVELLAPHIKGIFTRVIQDGFLVDWTTSVVIPLFKSGDINNPSNYCTIMVKPLLGKLFGSLVERRISSWAEAKGKRAKGQEDASSTCRLEIILPLGQLVTLTLCYCRLHRNIPCLGGVQLVTFGIYLHVSLNSFHQIQLVTLLPQFHSCVAFMASSSSVIASPKLYDAFISHQGPDVKETLAKHLYHLLRERGCQAFLDRPEIQVGDSIPFALRNAICSSFVQIAIFSQGYAESSWCLDELVLMLQQTDALFIPVFYNVQPWELRHIENEKSQYAEAFSYYERRGRYPDKLDEWRRALKSAADISGYELSQHQDNLCGNIVSRVLQVVQERKNRILLDVAKYPIGLGELVEDFETCLERRKSSGYHASSFLSDVRESHARGELHHLQSQLLKDLLKIEDLKIGSVHHGIGELKDRLGRARHLHFLIALDDIDHLDQLDALLPQGMLGSSSLVIITTRDQSMLTDANICYKMKEMSRDQAKDLFCSHASRGQDPPIEYEQLVQRFVHFCGGLPLSLKVLGAHLYGRKEYYWELELEKVKKIQPKDILERLKIIFDGLDQEEKQIFIDIACFFNKIGSHYNPKSVAITIWNAFGWSAEHGLQTLQDKSLVEIKWDEFQMHDHLRDLGRQMADDLGPPRLWRPQILRSMVCCFFKIFKRKL
ncbi:disease resistance protein Roq1-like [Cryptomeria japonica]|uniref:disease resistance protein Roq1-like n=1 Tax=Cryptomeria japonica TaxID=3369 RepID=UPI0027D9D0B7|nr:disease resistance protein Roq1-like [Cryptomeria japonica]